MTDTKQVAQTILQQLGGNKFVAMTGAWSFSSGLFGNEQYPGLSFRVGRNAKGIKGVQIILEASDTYRVKFLKQRRAPSYEVITVADVDGVYCDRLREVFERYTGLLTSLGTMAA